MRKFGRLSTNTSSAILTVDHCNDKVDVEAAVEADPEVTYAKRC
jgi:hypothetical protein